MLIGRAGSSSAKAGLKNKLRVSSVRIEVKVEVATEELTNLESKSKVQVQTKHWVFTKIRYSNHPTPGKFQRSKI